MRETTEVKIEILVRKCISIRHEDMINRRVCGSLDVRKETKIMVVEGGNCDISGRRPSITFRYKDVAIYSLATIIISPSCSRFFVAVKLSWGSLVWPLRLAVLVA
jgi:hypothetical protein